MNFIQLFPEINRTVKLSCGETRKSKCTCSRDSFPVPVPTVKRTSGNPSLCEGFEKNHPIPDVPLNESINEVSIINDSAVVFGTSLGEVLDTDVEVDDNNNDEENASGRKIKKKPSIHQPCIYCSKMQSALTRHVFTKHKNEPAVSVARKSRTHFFFANAKSEVRVVPDLKRHF